MRVSHCGLFSSILFLLVPATNGLFAETLPNGIELPEAWPPRRGAKEVVSGEPMPVPYLKNPPAVIPIDVGRQLLVDDFLIEANTLRRTFHRPDYHPENPVLRPEADWERTKSQAFAAPYSDGVWYDPTDRDWKMFYRSATGATCLALSNDGIKWERPVLNAETGTNLLYEKSNRDAATFWLDYHAKDPARRFIALEARWTKPTYRLRLRVSGDARTWTDEILASGPSWDRSSIFWNPFRNVWVASVRGHDQVKPAPLHRSRNYHEGKTLEEALSWTEDTDEVSQGKITGALRPWIATDRLDPHHPDPRFTKIEPQLYNLDVFPYESLLVGLFTIWQGPENEECKELGIHKRNEVFTGFTRDGFHWDRPDRKAFLPVSDDPKAWNAANVQSAGGGCVVVGDLLYFYCSGRTMFPSNITSTGLATLRRDGFASLDADEDGGSMTTRPVTFSGGNLFVNMAAEKGELRVEALDQAGQVIEPFSFENCKPLSGDDTARAVEWSGAERNLSRLAGHSVRFRFILKSGSLYSFWVSENESGTSHGFLAPDAAE